MKKILGLCVALCPMIANADTLDDKIASLIAAKNAKIAELEKCQKATGNLKIAGITTLGVSAIGVAVNIGEAVSLNKLDDKIDAAQAQKANLDKQIGDARAAKLAAERAAKEAEQKAREKALREKELLADTGYHNSASTRTSGCFSSHRKGVPPSFARFFIRLIAVTGVPEAIWGISPVTVTHLPVRLSVMVISAGLSFCRVSLPLQGRARWAKSYFVTVSVVFSVFCCSSVVGRMPPICRYAALSSAERK